MRLFYLCPGPFVTAATTIETNKEGGQRLIICVIIHSAHPKPHFFLSRPFEVLVIIHKSGGGELYCISLRLMAEFCAFGSWTHLTVGTVLCSAIPYAS